MLPKPLRTIALSALAGALLALPAFIVYTYATMPDYDHMPVVGPKHDMMVLEQARADAVAADNSMGCDVPLAAWVGFLAWPVMTFAGFASAAGFALWIWVKPVVDECVLSLFAGAWETMSTVEGKTQ